jgi:putative copper export protein
LLIAGIKFLHFLAMAIWIGAAAAAPIGMRRSLARGADHATDCVRRLQDITKLIVPSAILTLFSGVALVELSGGWRNAPARTYAATALTLLVILVGATIARPTLAALRAHFAAGGDAHSAEPLRRRFVLIANLEMAMRIAVLALMVLR